MTQQRTRARTVLVQLRSMTSRILSRPAVRRLLVIGVIAVAGWLLGSVGQAHAETGPEPAADITRAVVGAAMDETAKHRAVSGVGLPGGTTTIRPDQSAHPRTPIAKPRRSPFGGLVRGVVDPIRGHGFLGLPSTIERVVIGFIPTTGGIGADLSGAVRYGTDAVAPDAERVVAHSVAPGTVSPATKEIRSVFAQVRPGTPDPASQPGFPARATLGTGASSSAGSVLPGGAVGHLIRLGSVSRSSTALASVLGAIPPAVHTATDEPALSPD